MRNVTGAGPLVFGLGLVSVAAAAVALFWLSQSTLPGARLKSPYYILSLAVGMVVFLLGSGPVYYWLHRNRSD